MKTTICVFVLLIVLFWASSTVTEGDFHYSLELVKALGALMTGDDASAKQELQLVDAKAAAVCSHPALPADFKLLCLRKDAGASLARLGNILFLKRKFSDGLISSGGR
ncbi:uncharacterized protein LOC144464186 [Epinephelus lanceolatus]